MGSATPPAPRGAYHQSASVCHCAAMAPPETSAIASEPPIETMRSTGREREIYRLAADVQGVIGGQIALVGALESGKCPQQNEKCERKKAREDAPFEPARLPEDLAVAERLKPQQVNPVGERGAAAEHDDGDDGDENQQSAAVMSPRRCQPGPIDRIGQLFTPLFLLFCLSSCVFEDFSVFPV
jgi:hypothetical protein